MGYKVSRFGICNEVVILDLCCATKKELKMSCKSPFQVRGLQYAKKNFHRVAEHMLIRVLIIFYCFVKCLDRVKPKNG